MVRSPVTDRPSERGRSAHESGAAPRPTPSAVGRVLGFGFGQLVRRGLRGVWVRGTVPSTPTVWAANHHSWWDGFVAAAVLADRRRGAALLMDGDNLSDYRFLSSIGVIPTGRPRQALQAVRDGRVLVIFPEGELRPPGALGPLAPGAGWLARLAPAALLPVAVRVVVRGHQHPEAYLDLGPAVTGAELAPALADRLRALDELLADTDPRMPPAGFDQVLSGRHSWDERISRWSRTAR